MPTIHTDSLTRRLFAADASMYEELPAGVAFPRSVDDLRELVAECRAAGLPITPRSAGTSLAGQATGHGVIVDVSRHMDAVVHLDPEARYAVVQPGVIRDTLNRLTAPHRLQFGPDTSTTNRCTLGGMIGNNSSGLFSIRHGTTRDHVLELEAVLADGSVATFRPLSPEELAETCAQPTLEGRIYRETLSLLREHRETILAAYPHPEIVRRNTGYALDLLCHMDPIVPGGAPFNLVPLLSGSEGTLALTASARVRLVEIPAARALVVAQFRTLREATLATVKAVERAPTAVELVDDPILQATKVNLEQRRNRFFLEGDPAAILIIEFDGASAGEAAEKASAMAAELAEGGLGYAHPVIREPGRMKQVWDLRKAGLGLLMGLGSDSRSPSFVEDTAVRVVDLPDYVEEFQKILDAHGKRCVFYGHASVGELHLRPMIDLTQPEGIETMKAMARDVATLVRRYRGSLSGEHGDGRARAPFLEIVLGPEILPLLARVKAIWDPDGLFNPGKIVAPRPMEEGLRFSPAYTPAQVETVFNWRETGGFGAALEMCNGAGVCRKLAAGGGTMCPSYQATREEKDSTRGRANLFRQLFSGMQQEAFTSGELKEALDLCLSCKACKSECPANVDMARMKAEFTHGLHQRTGTPLADRFFGEPERLYPLAAATASLSNTLLRQAPVKRMLRQLLGVDERRDLPSFAPQRFRSWFRKRRTGGGAEGRWKAAEEGAPASGSRGPVALLVDIFTDHHEPEIGRAAVEILERLGYRVVLPDIRATGRPQISRGLLSGAAELCRTNLPVLHELVAAGTPIVGLEPSELLTLRDEYLDLCSAGELDMARRVAGGSHLLEEFLLDHLERMPGDAALLDGGGRGVAIHGHCHTKALVGNHPLMELLSRCGYRPRALETGCCGMAGSFGYEATKYDVSMEIGELVLFPAVRAMDPEEILVAPGFSCRHQVADGTGRTAVHPAILLAGAPGAVSS
jgi:FAD/FMN-containing dehydrogenase/Fe-S oxidoreductase